jgi:hypothetical protein
VEPAVVGGDLLIGTGAGTKKLTQLVVGATAPRSGATLPAIRMVGNKETASKFAAFRPPRSRRERIPTGWYSSSGLNQVFAVRAAALSGLDERGQGMRGLKNLLQPGSVAVIGASEKPESLGSHVIANLQAGAYAGPVLPVHPRYQSVQRILSYKTVEDMPIVPDLAILCTPAGPTPDIVARLGARGTGAAIVMTEDLDGSAPDTTFKRSLMAAALGQGPYEASGMIIAGSVTPMIWLYLQNRFSGGLR